MTGCTFYGGAGGESVNGGQAKNYPRGTGFGKVLQAAEIFL